MIFEILIAFAASFFLGIIFNINRRELIFCGIAGLTSEGIYQLFMRGGIDFSLSYFVSAAAVTALARVLANLRRTPVTVYLLPGIIPLVPGAGMYNTVFSIIASDLTYAAAVGVDTIKTAVAVAVGIVLVFALPNKVFLKRRY